MPDTLALHSLPLFPLGAVLFPGGVLALKVFEVRYLDMIGRCHRAGAPFGVVALAEGAEVRLPGAADERLHGVGTLARIEQLQAPQPGLMLVRCRGGERFRLGASHRLKHGLWVGDVTLIAPDRPLAVPPDLAPVADALRTAYAALRQRAPEAPLVPEAEENWNDCGWIADRWCELLPLPLATRQQLMSLDNPLMRLELVADVLARSGIGGEAAQ